MCLLHVWNDRGRGRALVGKAKSQRCRNRGWHEPQHVPLLQLSKNHESRSSRRAKWRRGREGVAMSTELLKGVTIAALPDPEAWAYDEPVDRVDFHFGVTRREVLAVLGAGLVIAVAEPLVAQDEETPAPARGPGRGGRGGRGGGGGFCRGPTTYAARLPLCQNRKITGVTGQAPT